MNREQAGQVINEYVKKLYGFALKKTANLQDAEDLAQEIACKVYSALLVSPAENVGAFVWRVAHNALANYYRGKTKIDIGIPIDALSDVLQSGEDIAESVAEKETVQKLQKEIAYLSKLQRKIVIMYYYEDKKQSDIAKILDVPLGTVKWHLFEAKSELRKGMDTMRIASELKFNPITFTIMGVNGSIGTMGGTSNFFRSVLTQNIAYSVYRQARTVNEIADCLGVSPAYVESEVDFLEEYGFLIKKNDKYLANMLIDEPNESAHIIAKLQEEMYSKAAKIFANALYDELQNSELLDGNHGVIYNPDDSGKPDRNFMIWSLLFYIAAVSGEKLMEHSITFDEVAAIRPDGAKNIAYAGFESADGPKQKYFDSIKRWCGPCWNASGKHILWQIDSEWSDRRVNDRYQTDVARDLSLFSRLFGDELLSIDEYAYMVERGYLITEGTPEKLHKTALQIVWIQTNEAKQKLIAIGDSIKEKHKSEFDALKAPFVKAVMASTPEHLKKVQAYGMQYIFFADGWFLLYCAKELVNNGRLKLPTKKQKKSLTTMIMPK